MGLGVGIIWEPLPDLDMRLDYGIPLINTPPGGMTFRITASISDLVIEFKVKAMFNRFLQRYGKKEKAILQALIASLFYHGNAGLLETIRHPSGIFGTLQ